MKYQITLTLALVIALSACEKHKATTDNKISEVRFAPPVVKPDNEVLSNNEVAERETAGDPNADIQIEEPVGSSDVKVAIEERPMQVADQQKKIIKEGDISFESNDVVETRRQILGSLKKLGGFVDDDREDMNGDEGRKEYVLSIKLPANNFDAFLSTVSSTAAKVDSRNIRIKDVTTQFIDTKTRLANKLLLENRYLDLLKKGNKISDLLQIENKLAEIRSDIESTQNQLNYLSRQVAFSSLTITFYTTKPAQVASGNGFFYKLIHALGDGFASLETLFFNVIAAWPLWALIVIVVIGVRKWMKRRPLPASN